ncbi:MAG TPA: Na-translocating system protein MpsC family protein [Solirubrobacterales bacterium]|nr:Na-translocating system protein MpsC family protein [Solirubrobacterales bacterium]
MPENPIQESIAADASGAMAAGISREIVGIYAEYYGRGPTKAKTLWREDVITCVLEDAFTRAEQVLVHGNRFEQVRINRQAFQEQIEPLLRDAVEKVTGRRIRSCLSQINRDGVAVEVFVLGPPIPATRP